MYLDGMKPARLGSVEDRIRNTVWYRREQRLIFQSLISVYAAMIQISPDVSKKVEGVIDDYIDLIIPGSKEFKKKSEENSLKKNAEALTAIYKALRVAQSNPFANRK